MKLTKLLCLSLCLMSLFVGCENREQDATFYEPISLSMDSIAEDTTKVLIAELPIWFDSTKVMIQGIVFRTLKNRDSKSQTDVFRKSSYDYNDPYGFSFNSDLDVISGNMVNLYFDDIDKNEQHLLTNKALNITNVYYLRDLAKKTNRNYLIYEIYDKDYNGDGNLDNQDLRALYISSLDGTGFAKITDDYCGFIDGKMVMMNLRYYFRTYEDVNKNCRFDIAIDKYGYYYIDFTTDPYKVKKYDPFIMEKNK